MSTLYAPWRSGFRRFALWRIGLVAVTLALLVPTLLATPSLLTRFVARYPAVDETKLNSCATCHMPYVSEYLNSYGAALKDAQLDFEAVENEDSDGDGKTNIEELKALTPPGSLARYTEYYIFNNSQGAVHFNHEAHVSLDSYLPKNRCAACHGPDKFKRRFDDTVPVREVAHQVCIQCHQKATQVSQAPTKCSGCHEKPAAPEPAKASAPAKAPEATKP
jgi:hypothetical protein